MDFMDWPFFFYSLNHLPSPESIFKTTHHQLSAGWNDGALNRLWQTRCVCHTDRTVSFMDDLSDAQAVCLAPFWYTVVSWKSFFMQVLTLHDVWFSLFVSESGHCSICTYPEQRITVSCTNILETPVPFWAFFLSVERLLPSCCYYSLCCLFL